MTVASEFLDSIERTQALLVDLERSADPATVERVREIVEGVLAFHGAAAARIVELTAAGGGPELVRALADDELVAALMLLYELHPDGLKSRVEKALATVRPGLRGHGGDVELVEIADDVVRLRLKGNCHGCPSSAATMKSTVEEAVFAVAPDVARIELIDDASPAGGFVPVEAISMCGAAAMAESPMGQQAVPHGAES